MRHRTRIVGWLIAHSTAVGALVASILLVVAGWVVLVPNHDHDGAAACMPLSYPPLQGTLTCYAAGEITAAERRFPVRPIDPSAMIASLAHLRLIEAYIYQYRPLAAAPQPGPEPVVGITYVFGSSMGQIEKCTRAADLPAYLAVQEVAGHTDQDGVSTTGNVCKLWNVVAANHTRGIDFSVSSNLPRDIVILAAKRIEESHSSSEKE